MFSDKFRFLKMLILILSLSGLAYYAQTQGPKVIPGFEEFKNNPSSFINKELGFQGEIIKIDRESFVVTQINNGKKTDLTIKGTLAKAKLKDNISGVAIYRADKTLILDRYIISNSRPAKIVISLIALLVVAFLFFRDFAFNFKNMVFKERL